MITENYSALPIVEQELIKNKDDYVVIFGSSFPKDQEYTQVSVTLLMHEISPDIRPISRSANQ